MKPYFIAVSFAILFSACAGSSSEQKADAADSLDTTPSAAYAISDYAASVDEKATDNIKTLAAHNFASGDNSAGVTGIFSMTNKPLRLYIFPEGPVLDSPSTETWFYLDSISSKVKLLREVITTKTSVTENSFYFENDSLIQSESRSAADLNALENATIAAYKSPFGDDDYRFNAAKVNELALAAGTALSSDRKDLSKGANEVRQQGATFWATGNEPGWSLAVIPNKKIVYTGDYGKVKLDFPNTPIKTRQNGSFEFTTSASGKTMEVVFEEKRCTDDAGHTHPYEVTLKVDGKTLRGCGQSLR